MSLRYLITTSDERTWKFDRPVLFLGEWCRIYDRKHIWESMDAIVAAPYGLGQSQKDADYALALQLKEKLFPDLCSILNHYHGTQHGERFWQIVTGFWFSRFVNVIINRFKTLEHCLNKYQISGTTTFSNDQYPLSTADSSKAVWSFEDDRWNNALHARLFELLNFENLLNKTVSYDEIEGYYGKPLFQINSTRRRLLIKALKSATRISSKLVRRNDAFIIASFLSKKEEIKLQLALGQFPQLWRRVNLQITSPSDRVLRKTLAQQVAKDTDDKLEIITRALLFELLPVCYLEGFNELNACVARQPWPKTPKFIYTCNNFDRDEVFTLWTANKTEKGVKYVTGQHGSNYGTSRYMNPSIEEATADRFLTWGWTDGLPQHKAAFPFLRWEGRHKGIYNRKGGLLLIEVSLLELFETWDVTNEFADYFKNQQAFVTALAPDARERLSIRLHREFHNKQWNEPIRWKSFDASLKIDTGEKRITGLIAQSRLVVFSYDSTGLLENLALNIPSIAFWQNGFDHLRDNAIPYYQLLVDAGIVHLSAESAARKVNEIWDDVDRWWLQTTMQDARKRFCEQYARVSKAPVQDLKKILLDGKS